MSNECLQTDLQGRNVLAANQITSKDKCSRSYGQAGGCTRRSAWTYQPLNVLHKGTRVAIHCYIVVDFSDDSSTKASPCFWRVCKFKTEAPSCARCVLQTFAYV